jgi:hypothetical protein
MKRIDKIKEYIIAEFPGKYILKEFEFKLSRISTEHLLIDLLDYYNNYFNSKYEWEIIDEIRNDVDEKFKLSEKEMLEVDAFIIKYMKLMIKGFRKSGDIKSKKIQEFHAHMKLLAEK